MKASISQIKLFKACRKAWEFKYVEKLIPVQATEARETGKRYHGYLEMLENGEELPGDYTKEEAMAAA